MCTCWGPRTLWSGGSLCLCLPLPSASAHPSAVLRPSCATGTEYSDAFAEEFVQTTTGWGSEPGAYIDDRHAPGYVRSSEAAAAQAAKWDGMLQRLAPAALAARVKGPAAS